MSTTTNDNNEPSHIMTGDYAILQEINDKESECWITFIRRKGNNEILEKIQNQLKKVDQVMLKNMSTFTLELSPWVSAKTAKEMSKIDMNSYSFHRKFDGKLLNINFGFKNKDSNETMTCKVFDHLGYGQINDYIDDEDIDAEDLLYARSDSDDESGESDDESDDESDESDSDESDSDRENHSPSHSPSHSSSHSSSHSPSHSSSHSRDKKNKEYQPSHRRDGSVQVPKWAFAKKRNGKNKHYTGKLLEKIKEKDEKSEN